MALSEVLKNDGPLVCAGLQDIGVHVITGTDRQRNWGLKSWKHFVPGVVDGLTTETGLLGPSLDQGTISSAVDANPS